MFNRSIAMTPEEGNRLGIINKSTLWYQKSKIWLKAKEPIYNTVFQNQGDQIREV